MYKGLCTSLAAMKHGDQTFWSNNNVLEILFFQHSDWFNGEWVQSSHSSRGPWNKTLGPGSWSFSVPKIHKTNYLLKTNDYSKLVHGFRAEFHNHLILLVFSPNISNKFTRNINRST